MAEQQPPSGPDTPDKIKSAIWSDRDLDVLDYLVAKKAKAHVLGWLATAGAVLALAGFLGWHDFTSVKEELDKKAVALEKKGEEVDQRATKLSERFEALLAKQEQALTAFRDSQDRVIGTFREDEKEVRRSTDLSRQEIFGAGQSLLTTQREMTAGAAEARKNAELTSRIGSELQETEKRTQKQIDETLHRIDELEPYLADTYRISTAHASAEEPAGSAEPGSSRARHRPALGGDSVSYGLATESVSAQTLSCLVRDSAGVLYVLTAGPGPVRPGGSLYQPGLLDGGRPDGDEIARLERSIAFGSGRSDLAVSIAHVADPSLVSPEVRSIGRLTGVAAARLGEVVLKHGRTTGLRRGRVTSTDADLNLNDGGQAVLFKSVILVEGLDQRMAEAGDVGAVLVDSEHRAVGLLVASSTRYAAFLPMQMILDSLKVSLVTDK